MKNLLLLIESSETGGAETVFINLATKLDKYFYNVHIGLLSKGWLFDELVKEGFAPVIFDTAESFDLGFIKSLVKYVRRNNVSLIHSHLFGISVYASIVGRICNVPVVSTIHGTVDVRLSDCLTKVKFQILNQFARKIVYVSESLKQHFLRVKLATEHKSMVIYNGIDLNKYGDKPNRASLRGKLGYSEGDFIIGAIGDIRPAKGYQVLLAAVAMLSRNMPNLKVLIAGSETPLLNELKEMCSDLKLTDIVRFVGYRSDVPDLLKAIDMYVLSSVSEGFSLTTVEAMASGLPVVATRCGGPEEVIMDGLTGRLVPSGNPCALADAILELSLDNESSKAFGLSAKIRARECFSLDAMVSNYCVLYQMCLEPISKR